MQPEFVYRKIVLGEINEKSCIFVEFLNDIEMMGVFFQLRSHNSNNSVKLMARFYFEEPVLSSPKSMDLTFRDYFF